MDPLSTTAKLGIVTEQNDNQLVISGGIGSWYSSHSCDLC
jgi:hypothetical protein